MSSLSLRFLILSWALFCLLPVSRAGTTFETAYTDRGKTDFDTVMPLLNPYGSWSKIDEKWAFTPHNHAAPYTNGRWLYTEYGWYWKGLSPHSWVTEHYGYWKRGADNVWSWYPGPYWLPEIVEFRASSKYLGWRSAEVDEDGNFVEQPIDRYSKPEEWTFVTLVQFANPVTPSIVAKPDVARAQLEISTDCRHTYLTYREIDRPGPHPADFSELCRDGGMLAPKTLRDELEARPSASDATNSPAAQAPGAAPPTLVGADIDPSADVRKVKYWITMSLPAYATPPPPDAKPGEIYLYRPDFYQDEDGIERRITLWFNPKARATLSDLLGGNTSGVNVPGARVGIPASPAVPASPDPTPAHNPFESPFDESFHPAKSEHSAAASTKGPAPSGLVSPSAPAPATNTPPAKNAPPPTAAPALDRD